MEAKDKNYFFAVDLGATSGRTILGEMANGHVTLTERSRFANPIIEMNGHFFWDIFALYEEIIKSLKQIAKEGIRIKSIGIDTWGVDFVCVGRDGQLLGNPYSYRDPHTEGIMEELFLRMPRKEIYGKTGIQFMNFNTLFQLEALRKNGSSQLEAADKILFVPDALSYLLTGKKVCEYTILSTGQLLNPKTGKIDPELLSLVGLTEEQFGRPIQPSQVIGTLTPEVQKMTGLGAIPVVAVAGHDTASAVAAVPAKDEHFAYLSSGTWSLMGIETREAIISEESFAANFTNEGGIEGTTRFLKNICGMWLLERCRQEWDAPDDYKELTRAAKKVEPFRSVINPDDPMFAAPAHMIEAIQAYCKQTEQPVPESYGEITRCIFDSLALRYREVFELLKAMAPMHIDTLHIIGGGSQNTYLSQLTANATKSPVVCGPVEGTALGNIMLQAKAIGCVKDIREMRRVIADSIDLKQFQPSDEALWEAGYEKYKKITNIKN
jgi:rhamnulokinase